MKNSVPTNLKSVKQIEEEIQELKALGDNMNLMQANKRAELMRMAARIQAVRDGKNWDQI